MSKNYKYKFNILLFTTCFNKVVANTSLTDNKQKDLKKALIVSLLHKYWAKIITNQTHRTDIEEEAFASKK